MYAHHTHVMLSALAVLWFLRISRLNHNFSDVLWLGRVFVSAHSNLCHQLGNHLESSSSYRWRNPDRISFIRVSNVIQSWTSISCLDQHFMRVSNVIQSWTSISLSVPLIPSQFSFRDSGFSYPCVWTILSPNVADNSSVEIPSTMRDIDAPLLAIQN